MNPELRDIVLVVGGFLLVLNGLGWVGNKIWERSSENPNRKL